MSQRAAVTIDRSAAPPSEEELLERARAIVPMLRERADEVDRTGVVPVDIVQAFREAGFFRIVQPKRWGGYEMSPLTFLRVLMEVGRGCGSSAWVLMILGTHQWEIGIMDPRAGDDVWGEDDTVLISSSYAPFGAVKKVDGGYVIDGVWRTSSGCDHARWAFVGGYLKDEQGRLVDYVVFLVPKEDYAFVDDWQVFGLGGTGSKSLEIRNAFVPDYRTHSAIEYKLLDRSEVYLFPFLNVFFSVVSALMIGFGQGAIEVFLEQIKGRKRTGGEPIGEMPHVRDQLGRALAKVRAARHRLEGAILEAARYTSKHQLVPGDVRAKCFLDTASIGDDVLQVVLSLYKILGPQAIFLSNPFQRVLRDVLAASVHPTQRFEDHASFLGAQIAGFVPALCDPFAALAQARVGAQG